MAISHVQKRTALHWYGNLATIILYWNKWPETEPVIDQQGHIFM